MSDRKTVQKKRTSVRERRWNALNRKIIGCEQCPRLIEHCQTVAAEKRAAYRNETYWGKPVPNFGDPQAQLLIVGLAPGAHGANRTGRMFTGDRSGDWLYRALHKAGFANQKNVTSANDGLQLVNCAITNACHCAPPGNKPTAEELANCAGWFDAALAQLPVRVLLALGGIAWNTVWSHFRSNCPQDLLSDRKPKFGHGASVPLTSEITLIGSYHPSQQNTFTGRLTEPMLNAVFRKVRKLADSERPSRLP